MVLNYIMYDARKCYLFTVCTEQMRSPYTEHAASGLPNPTRLEGGGSNSILLSTDISTEERRNMSIVERYASVTYTCLSGDAKQNCAIAYGVEKQKIKRRGWLEYWLVYMIRN